MFRHLNSFSLKPTLALVLAALNCSGSESGSSSFETFNEFQDLDCLWLSTCGLGDFFSCRIDSAELTDLWQIDTLQESYQERFSCLQGVSSCDEYSQCASVQSIDTAPLCPGDKSIVCDEAQGFWMNCDGGAEAPLPQGRPANVYYNLDIIGASCDGDTIAFPITACTETACNGRFIEGCFGENNPLATGFDGYDCASIDSDYACIVDLGGDFVCGFPSEEGCGEDGQAVRDISCKDDTTITFCERGETYDLSCPDGFSCGGNGLESRCVAP